MILRYSRKPMSLFWSDKNRYLIWLEVEKAVCEELARQKQIPKKDWLELKKKIEILQKKGGVDPARVEELESVTKHDVIAFTTAVAERIGPLSRYVHYGLTSSDVVDTALSLLIQRAGKVLIEDLEKLLKVLKKQARVYQKLPTIGRSHGIFAEPTSFGLKFLGWYCEFERNLKRLRSALLNLNYGKLSGAVGVNAHFDPKTEQRILSKLNLKRESVSTQVLPRDRHAELMCVLAIMGSSIERVAVELRHLQRSEVGEVREAFKPGQKGSSAMPHKRNPISSENLTGCARLLRSYAQAALENIALWHERDISHSSVERVVLPDAFILADYALNRLTEVLSHLMVDRKKVVLHLKQAGSSVYSGHLLLALVQRGLTREQAYVWIQECALQAQETGKDFIKILQQHEKLKPHLNSTLLRRGELKYQLRHVSLIFNEVLRKSTNG